jgi:FkbM family methyltransferase
LSDDVQRHAYFGLYDQALTRQLQRILKPGGVFYDVGANIGFFTLWGARCVGSTGEVHAFEPVPANRQRIEATIAANGLKHVAVNGAAVSDEIGTLTLYLPESVTNSGWASVVPSERRTVAIDVPTTTLDDYVLGGEGRRMPNLIKIDIEGSEPRALSGMRRMLAAADAPDLIIEVNPYLLGRSDSSPAALVDPLVAAGYHVFLIDERGLSPRPDAGQLAELVDVFATKRPQDV